MPDEHQPRRQRRFWSAALIALCLATFFLQARHIDQTLPYPRDVDEGFVSGPASRTLTTGTFHPYRFTYGSLPKYLAALGMGVGFVQAASHLEVRDIQALGNVGYPYYDTPRALQGARRLFALLSIVALAATGVAAWQVTRVAASIFVAPFLVSLSPLYVYHSWNYLNVDIVALCFAALAIAACAIGTRRSTLLYAAVLPAVYVGMATGSKYTMATAFASVLACVLLFVPAGRRVWSAIVAFAVMVAAFLVVMPYALIDLPGFLSGVAFEAYHYASGHAGFQDDPGLPQLWFYLKHFVADFGPVAGVLAAAGAVALFAADWRRACVLFAFPAALGWLLLRQRVHFERNALALYPIVAVSAAYGAAVIHSWLVKRFVNPEPMVASRRLSAAIALLLFAAAVPWWHVPNAVRGRLDSRNAATAWLERRMAPGTSLLVPRELAFDTRRLKAHGVHVIDVDMKSVSTKEALHRLVSDVEGAGAILVPEWDADTRLEGADAVDTLRAAAAALVPVVRFGSHPVLVNYSEPVPWGDPRFGIAPIGGLVIDTESR